ncbi:site-specific integrase [Paraburkholderia diazotrophica]|uniref:Phage integrase family protein n=1 Tax=Paraburkholderia diazotrophica TaxID=667676 RepID=A0A1H7E8V1_9BURK|nr:hypothetical protein SAMN05192539_104448 [Paraburkholderia diazotrophica]
MRHRKTAFGHHFSEISKDELETQVPAHAKDNNFAIEVAPVEQSVNVFQLTRWLVLVKNSSVTDQRNRIQFFPLDAVAANTLLLARGGGERNEYARRRRRCQAAALFLRDRASRSPHLATAPRRAIWALYRNAGVRLIELLWSDEAQLPKVEVDEHGSWTLTVLGKGRRTRAIPLPAVCVSVLRIYGELPGLPSQPPLLEHAALVHGLRAAR